MSSLTVDQAVAPEAKPSEPRVSLSSVPQNGAQWDQLLKRMVRDEAARPGIASFSSSV